MNTAGQKTTPVSASQADEVLAVLDLPTDHPRLAIQPFQAGLFSEALPGSLVQDVQSFAAKQQVNPAAPLFAAFTVLLFRYSGQDQFTIGFESPEGMFGVSSDLSGDPSGRSAIQRLNESIQKAVTSIGAAQILFGFNEGLSVNENGAARSEKTDVALRIERTGDGLATRFHYNGALFEAATIQRLSGHYRTLLHGLIHEPDTAVSRLAMLTGAEKHQILVDWNNTAMPFPEGRCLHQLFEERVADGPERIAVISAGEQLTYAQLNARSNRLARHLGNMGVGRDVLVGLCVERSVDMVVGLMAIAKAGGAYVPLDATYPKERLGFMLEDSRVPVLLTQQRLLANLPQHEAQVFCIDTELPLITESEENPAAGATPENLAYVIYTSGSTGRPKGVVLNHRGRVNNFHDFNQRFSIGTGDRIIAVASLSFDMCAYDVFGTLSTGSTIVLPSPEDEKDPGAWAELMVQHDVTIWHSAPAMLQMLVEYISKRPELAPHTLRLVLLGGDWIPLTLPDRLRSLVPRVTVVSMGGATEASMDSTIYVVEKMDPSWRSIPYGVPMANQLAYVLDQNLQLLPQGIPGELHLGGIGVARGYLNRPELTAEKFLPNPFVSDPAARIYKTGDLARYYPDGNLELLGRMDQQVKVRGHRVELGEIVATLRQHPSVREAVVVAKDDQTGSKALVGYVVPNLQHESSATASEALPQEQVAQWQRVYEDTYGQTEEQVDPAFNIIGWNSSYTGLPIPHEEMKEWVADSVGRILALKPRDVLEIGVGSGLLMFPVAPHCESYAGIDFSATTIGQLRHLVSTPKYRLPNVTLQQKTADDFSGVAPNSYDCVVLNSIVQLFPSIEYLLKVLERAVTAVRPGGAVFAGDVISLDLNEAFETSVQVYQAPPSVAASHLRQRILKAMRDEEQLFVHPDFFAALKSYIPRISHVEIQYRRGRAPNEMTRFRYDVVLHVEKDTTVVEPVELDWSEQNLTIQAVDALLAQSDSEALRVTGVPNARVFEDVQAIELLKRHDGPPTAGELREVLSKLDRSKLIDPEDVWSLAEQRPWDVNIRPSKAGVAYFDVDFLRRRARSASPVGRASSEGGVDQSAQRLVATAEAWGNRPLPIQEGREAAYRNGLAGGPDAKNDVQPQPWPSYANNPLLGKLIQKLVPELRTFLLGKLPDHHVPSAIVLMSALPLSPNGKVDRRALPAPDWAAPQMLDSYTPPRNPIEEVIAGVWADVLAIPHIDVHRNFLELGGHSLLAVQIISRLQEIFPIKLPVHYLLGSPTVAQFAGRIEAAGTEAGADILQIAQLALEVGSLSDEQVRKMLVAENEGGAHADVS